ncbi:TRAP transporter, DctM subunit [Thermanaerovibrio velox DSM 12556]|uniref:TRAP transporter, DctM subunit n=1 Tax=Thermanaerovibrio velox DSM 12556 TaxID=926567 RepID=H0UP63_9BACT|nr:TRAP transporter large permease [Thermanaerovibrio velox]EHM09476.1 TRAP transporter, DctM subunit [Thermanaerovibrio velox DSM 12556]
MIYVALVVLMFCLLIGVPVPVSFMASAAWLIFFGGPDGSGYDPSQLLPYGFAQMNSVSLIAIAMFIMAGGIMERGRIGERLIDLVDVFVGHLKGGLGIVGTISCAVFGSISGAACATLSCIGSIMFPRFEAGGYPKGHAAALMSNASLLGLLIPPNATLIIFAWISGQSILACFLATVVPGLLATTLICLVNLYILKDNPSVLVSQRRSLPERFKLLKVRSKGAIPALLLPVIVLGGVYGGIMTTTEASAVAVLYSIPVALWVYRGTDWRGLAGVIVESAITTGVIMAMLYSVSMLSRLYVLEDLPSKMLYLFESISTNKWVIMGMINVFLVIMGMLMDDISVVVLTTPIMMPIIAKLGFNPIHYAAVVGVNTALGCITPPAAPVLYLGGRLAKAPINEMMGPALKFMLLCWVPVLLFTAYAPKLVLFLPHLLLGVPW